MCGLGVRFLVALRFTVNNRKYFVFPYKECTICGADEQRSFKIRVVKISLGARSSAVG